MNERENGGYVNAETYRFEEFAPNVLSVYTDVRNVAREMLRRVPSMTDQTLGANIKLHVRTWVLDAREGRTLRNYGWADHITVTTSPSVMLELADYVGDLTMLSETDLGASWRESVEETDR